MTCIAAAIDHDGAVWMGADSGLHSGDCSLETALPKVFRNGPFLLGVSGTSRVSQIARHVFEPPAVNNTDLNAYFVRVFVKALRECMRENGGECKNNEEDGPETAMDGRVLVGFRGRIFGIDGSYGVMSVSAPFQAIGSASVEARAAMFTAISLLPKPVQAEHVIKCALAAAVEFDGNIRPPFTILKLENE